MNLPITLTLLRIFFVPLLVVLLLTKGENLDLWAVGVFLLAAITDFLDGYFARRRRQVTTLGILLDPIADKLLTSAAFISLVELGLAQAWMVVIIIGRELAVSGLRAVASAEGYVLKASELGKTKMVLEVAAVTVIVLEDHFVFLQGFHAGVILLWLVVIFALASAAQYFWDFRKKLETGFGRSVREGVVIFQPGNKNLKEGEREERDVAAH
jgi:CDP-diacylglycerol---glycerol-3-phosphate 3-phosphatidyltransferase